MIDLLWIFLPAIFIIGFATSYTDFKSGKIFNIWIIIGLAYSILSYFILWLFNFSEIKITNDLLLYTAINFFIALVFAIVFWLNKHWNAADAKLFIVFSALLPLSAYEETPINYFFAFNIFFNSFIFIAIFVFFQMVYKSRWNHYTQMFSSKILTPLKIIKSLVILFIGQWLVSYFLVFFGIETNLLLSISLMILIVKPIYTILENNYLVLGIIVISRFLFDKSIYSIYFLMNYVIITAAYMILMGVITALSSLVFSSRVKINELKPGMLISEKIVLNGKKYAAYDTEIDNMPAQLCNSKNIKYLIEPIDGLSSEDIRTIKNAYKKGMLNFKDLKVKEHTYFAPHIFFGTLITIIVHGNILYYLFKVF